MTWLNVVNLLWNSKSAVDLPPGPVPCLSKWLRSRPEGEMSLGDAAAREFALRAEWPADLPLNVRCQMHLRCMFGMQRCLRHAGLGEELQMETTDDLRVILERVLIEEWRQHCLGWADKSFPAKIQDDDSAPHWLQ